MRTPRTGRRRRAAAGWVAVAVAALVGLGAALGPASAPASATLLTGNIKVDPKP